jgi:hypothetical protein
MMAKAPGDFDPMGVVIDWIDACKGRKLAALVELYDPAATVDCCEGGRFRGRSEVERYWRTKLAKQTADAFEINALMPFAEGVSLDYRGYDGRPVRTLFRFSASGQILHTACGPVGSNGSGSIDKPRAA